MPKPERASGRVKFRVLDQRMNRLAQETAVEHVGVGCDDLKDKTNAKTN
jgi:hypothetical protein